MPASVDDPLATALAELGQGASEDPLGAVDALLLQDRTKAPWLADRLARALVQDAPAQSIARIALGAAYLAAGDATSARAHLLRGLGSLPPGDPRSAARAALKLARAESALGNAAEARDKLTRLFREMVALDDPSVLADLASVLKILDESLASQAVERLALAMQVRASPPHLDLIARVARTLCASGGTAEPLHAILRAILGETGADRGFLMLYKEDTLAFEVGLARNGRVLGSDDFRYSTTIVADVLEKAKPVVLPDVRAWLRYEAARSAQELGIRSALCVPLLADRRRHGAAVDTIVLPSVRGIAGVIYGDSSGPGSFAATDVRLLEVLADCASLAVRAARTGSRLAVLAAAAAEDKARARRAGPGSLPEIPERAVSLRHAYEDFVTRDHGLQTTLALVDRVIESDASVLVRGESGTGKELVARAIHRYGPRKEGPFVAVDCGAVSDELVASELFGHEAGAFTGATASRPGLLEQAHGGTLFLDEVAEMPAAMQAALLRALQEGEVRRVGGREACSVDVRVVAATHRDLKAMVERGEFRHDLYFRIAGVEVRLPPLRERRGDVPLLVRHLLPRLATAAGAKTPAIEPAAIARLEEHGWPGNVRQLENVLQALVLRGRAITPAEVEDVLGDAPAPEPLAVPAGERAAPLAGTLEDIERRAIAERLEKLGWNQVQAAQSLGIGRKTLYLKIRRYGIEKRKG